MAWNNPFPLQQIPIWSFIAGGASVLSLWAGDASAADYAETGAETNILATD